MGNTTPPAIVATGVATTVSVGDVLHLINDNLALAGLGVASLSVFIQLIVGFYSHRLQIRRYDIERRERDLKDQMKALKQ